MIKVGKLFILVLWMLMNIAFASVPHRVEKYGLGLDLPDGFTKLVREEVPSQRVYDSYHGNYADKSFVHVHIQKEDMEGGWSAEDLQRQLQRTVNIYKEHGAKIVRAEVVHLPEHDGLLLHSIHGGKEHLTLQRYCHGTMYIVTSTFDGKDKYGVKEFDSVLASVKCLREH